MVVKVFSGVLPSVVLIHADIVDIKCPYVGQDMIPENLLMDAEGVAYYLSLIINTDKDRGFIILHYGFKLFCIVLGGGAFEYVGPPLMVDHVNLYKKLKYGGYVFFFSTSYGIHIFRSQLSFLLPLRFSLSKVTVSLSLS